MLKQVVSKSSISKYRIALAAIFALGSLSVSASARAADAPQTPFVKIVTAHWSTWDADHDGKLSSQEIATLMKDPTVKGDDAAAVAAMKLVTRAKKLGDLTPAFFKAYNDQATGVIGTDNADPTAADASVHKPIDSHAYFDKYMAAARKQITAAGDTQWPSTPANIEDIRQGPMGDCFFVSSMTSVAIHRPEQVSKIIAQQSDGSYRVTLPGVAPYTFAKLTDAQIAISGTSGHGAFLAVMEQAFGKYRAQLKGNSADVDGTDFLYRGGDSAPTLAQLTGDKTKRIAFGKYLEKREAQKDKVLPEVRATLEAALADHRAITCGIAANAAKGKNDPSVPVNGADDANDTSKDKSDAKETGTLPTLPPDIVKNHVYVVVNYDPKTDIVEIWNPHGQTFKPKGEPGLENGFPTEHGRFKLPLTEAYQIYTSFTFEQETPADPPKVVAAKAS